MKYYSVDKAMTYDDNLYYFIVGARRMGKTYSAKKYAIRRFIKYNEEFVYLRRYKTELKKVNTFFSDLINDPEFKDVKFEVKGKTFYINDKVAGYAMNLSTAKIEKGNNFPNVFTIIFDEFIIEEGVYRYLNGDVDYFLNLYQTIDNNSGRVKVLFLANAISYYNPYFLYYDLPKPRAKNGIYNKKFGVYLEVIDNSDYSITEDYKKSTFAKMHEGTEYYKSSFDNEFVLDKDTFIKKDFEDISNKFNIKSNGTTYGVWFNYDEGYIIVREKHDPTIITYTTFKDHEPNTLILKVNKSYLLQNFKKAFLEGNVYFENHKIYAEIYKTIKKIV